MSTTVFVVMNHDIESDELLGVFSTKDAARIAIEKHSATYRQKDERGQYGAAHFDACRWMDADIEEYRVQEE